MFRLVLRPTIYLVSEVLLTNQKYKDAVQAGIFFDRLLENIRRLPGVVAAGMTNNPPFSYQEDGNYTPFAIVGRPLPEQGQAPASGCSGLSHRVISRPWKHQSWRVAILTKATNEPDRAW